MTTLITLTQNYTYLYMFICIVSSYFLITYNKTLSVDNLLDYGIYLTTKIVLFTISLSFLLISIVMMLNGDQATTDYFINTYTSNILVYCFFNYGLFYLLIFLDWFKEFLVKNDLYAFSLIKDKVKMEKEK